MNCRTLEILARPPEGETIKDEFRHFLLTCRERGWKELKVMFAFAWGNDVYEDDWQEEVMSPEELERKVRETEAAGFGSISRDDLYVTVMDTGVDFTFCHENDIHLSSAPDCSFLHDEKARFLDLGWDVSERIKDGTSKGDWSSVSNDGAPID